MPISKAATSYATAANGFGLTLK